MAQRRTATVTQINNFIKVLIDRTEVLSNIWIKGEISNLKLHSSGHIYLTLKDEGAVLRAVMFKSAAAKLLFKPENGMKITAGGRIGVFERDGQYQLYIEQMELEGQGDLYQIFEELKRKLGAEGLFDENRKKPIGAFPTRIGIVTSPTGAAVRDIINILSRRYPVAKAYLYPALVQGVGACESICKGIRFFNKMNNADVIIIGRGGGSIEDLWAFNEEATVRAVAESNIPIISAVGHETDFTLSDFAADLRAPTPSAAAELAVPDIRELRSFIESSIERAKSLLVTKTQNRERQLTLLTQRSSLMNFSRVLDNMSLSVDRAQDALSQGYQRNLESKENSLSQSALKLDALSPLKAFERGYSVAFADGHIVKSVRNIAKGDNISVTLRDGIVEAAVSTVKERELK